LEGGGELPPWEMATHRPALSRGEKDSSSHKGRRRKVNGKFFPLATRKKNRGEKTTGRGKKTGWNIYNDSRKKPPVGVAHGQEKKGN